VGQVRISAVCVRARWGTVIGRRLNRNRHFGRGVTRLMGPVVGRAMLLVVSCMEIVVRIEFVGMIVERDGRF